ncbi:MAG: excinuclease ABC subunit UvrA [bacterium]
MQSIQVLGAREHNLKAVHVEIPRERLVVITGPSGSGKSSLARDTLYAEGHRRYVESLSAEARQLLQQIRKPDVDRIEGLPPAICIDQRSSGRNPRSTVGTMTELADLLRLLFAKVGAPTCPSCGEPIRAQSLEQMADRILDLPEGTRLMLLAPLPPAEGKGPALKSLLEGLERQGFLRVRVDGEVLELGDPGLRRRTQFRSADVVVDRLILKPGIRSRLNDSIEMAAKLSDGVVTAWVLSDGGAGQERTFSESARCVKCRLPFPKIHPKLFSFNSPEGACPACGGIGRQRRVDPDRVVPDPGLSIREGALRPWQGRSDARWKQTLESLARHGGFDLYTPFKRLPARARELVLYGSGEEPVLFRFESGPRKREELRPFEGVIPNLERRYRETASERVRQEIRPFMSDQVCAVCSGYRLRPEALHVRIREKHIGELASMSIEALEVFLRGLDLSAFEEKVIGQALAEIRARLELLRRLGLEYLSLSRESLTLSGGELQRVQLASHIGSGLVGVLYILDEPTMGLHARDTNRLLDLVKRLRDRGNTVLVVEHDRQTILEADHVIDMGPGAGVRGGNVVFSGGPEELKRCTASLTGQFLSGARAIPVPEARGRPDRGLLVLRKARLNNLKTVTARFPVGRFTCVTGVSGSGKSTLVLDTLYPALARRLSGLRSGPASAVAALEGAEFFDKVVPVDQAPLSRSPRSNPATYMGIFGLLRDLFAQLPEARRRGYGPARFSFNVKGGRCEVCQGEGLRKVEMHFLPDVYVTCDLCGGRRYNRETLEVRYRGRSIAEVLEMTVEEARRFFEPVPQLEHRLGILAEVGLEYLQLGQAATTLSGGEAQRVKLARELARASTGRTLYILDEPTTGLHFTDIEKLLGLLQRLIGAGNTVVVIEHNLDVIKTADYVIDMGPEGGEQGGRIVAQGTPEEVAGNPASHTGRFLREALG